METSTSLVAGGLIPNSSKERNRLVYFGLIVIALIACVPLLQTNTVMGHDTLYHVFRIEAMTQELANGQVPVRIETSQLEGYGYASGVMYGNIFFYIPAVLHLLGIPLDACLTIFMFLINIGTVVVSYVSFYHIFGKRSIALTCTALWTLQLYRLTCLYTRCALGECLALMCLPLLVWGIYALFAKNDTTWDGRLSWLIITLGFTGIILSHTITTEVALITSVVIGLILFIRKHSWVIGKNILKCVLATVLINLWFIIPFLDYYVNADLLVTHWVAFEYCADNALDLTQLFALFPPATGQSLAVEAGIAGDLALSTGWALLVGLFVWTAILIVPSWRKKAKTTTWYSVGNVSFVAALIFLWMTTTLFIWSFASSETELLKSIVSFFSMVQYPWRFLSFAALFLVVLSGVIAILLYKFRRRLALPFLGTLTCLAFIFSLAFLTSYIYESESWMEINIADRYSDSNYGIMNGEYLPFSVGDPYELDLVNTPVESDGLVLSDYQKKGTWLSFSVVKNAENQEDAGGKVLLPLYYYPGYKAKDVGSGESLNLEAGDAGRITLLIEPGFAGTVEVLFVEPWYWRISEVISLLTIIGIAFWLLLAYLKSRRNSGGFSAYPR